MRTVVSHVFGCLLMAMSVGCGSGVKPGASGSSAGMGGSGAGVASGGTSTSSGGMTANSGGSRGSGGSRSSGGSGGSGGAIAGTGTGGSAGSTASSGGMAGCSGSNAEAGGPNSGNPIIQGWYADPEIRIFGDRYYVYPTYSVSYDQQTFFEAFSSPDLVNWKSEGHVLELSNVTWSTDRAAWAPTVISRNGKYYFYFAAGDGAGIGVATATSPKGPFVDALGKALVPNFQHGAQPIDPYVFIDHDDQAYLYWGGWNHLVAAKLGSDMISFVSDSVELTPQGYVEGPVMLERNSTYYLMWSEGNWGDSSYSAAYGTGKTPLGPFTRVGKFLQTDAQVGTGPGHNSAVRVPCTNDWYIAYHRHPLGDGDANHRVTCVEHLRFAADGSIEPVVLTTDGVHARPLSPAPCSCP